MLKFSKNLRDILKKCKCKENLQNIQKNWKNCLEIFGEKDIEEIWESF